MPCRPALMHRQHHELQGPRPASLSVTNKESHKLMKKRRHHPVIIYVESPKVVHVHPGEFRSVVQRLTGAAPRTTTTMLVPAATTARQFPFQQLYGLANAALNKYDMDKDCMEFVASTMSPPVSSYLPGGASVFSSNDQLVSPALLIEDQNMEPAVAGPSSVQQANNLWLGSIGGASHVNRFIHQ